MENDTCHVCLMGTIVGFGGSLMDSSVPAVPTLVSIMFTSIHLFASSHVTLLQEGRGLIMLDGKTNLLNLPL